MCVVALTVEKDAEFHELFWLYIIFVTNKYIYIFFSTKHATILATIFTTEGC